MPKTKTRDRRMTSIDPLIIATAAISKAAAQLGRIGGQSKSPAKLAAARANARLGGRPKKFCQACGLPARRCWARYGRKHHPAEAKP